MARQMSRQSQGGQSQQRPDRAASRVRDRQRDARRRGADARRGERPAAPGAGRAPRSAASRPRRARSSNSSCAATARDARQRAAGELRLEAQQIADEQRRIAGEAERLEKSADAARTPMRWRRLAAEKDKLADRVDELQRGAERLVEAGRAPESQKTRRPDNQARPPRDSATSGSPAACATRRSRCATERPSSRRGGRPHDKAVRSPAPKVADAEQQIARRSDRVVDQLGAGDGDAEMLARQLDRSREMRERLDGLERQTARGGSEGRRRTAGARLGRKWIERGAIGAIRPWRRRHVEQGRCSSSASSTRRKRSVRARRCRGSSGVSQARRSAATSPEQHEWSVTDQGHRGIQAGLLTVGVAEEERRLGARPHDASVVARAARKSLDDRLSAGGSERVPEAYRRFIARYYESLARKK